jgi:hypothetical protein
MFSVLSFDLDPRLSLFPELSEMIRGDAHILKQWEHCVSARAENPAQ